MIVAGADLATTSGLAILEGTRVIHIESHRPQGKTDCEIFTGFRVWLRSMLIAHGVEHLGIEAPLVTDIKAPARGPHAKPGETHNPVTMKTYLRLYGLRAHAVQIAHSINIGCTEIHQATWRKAFCGNGRATKEETLALAKRICPTLRSKDAAEALGVAWALNGELSKMDLFEGAA